MIDQRLDFPAAVEIPNLDRAVCKQREGVGLVIGETGASSEYLLIPRKERHLLHRQRAQPGCGPQRYVYSKADLIYRIEPFQCMVQ